jgi:hypothetical protein
VVEEIMEGSFRCIDRDIETTGKYVQAFDMVPVFVGDQDRPNLPGIKGRCVYSLEYFFCAQAGIKQKCPALPFEKNTIAFASAGKNRAAHRLIFGRSRIIVFNCSPVFSGWKDLEKLFSRNPV